MRRLTVIAAAALAVSTAQAAPRWTTSIDVATGLPTLEAGGARAVNPGFVFWAADWRWAPMALQVRDAGDAGYQAVGTDKPLGLSMKTVATPRPQGGWSVDFVLDGGNGAPSSGGGLVFHLSADAWTATMGDPVLLPDNRGWRWGREGGPQVQVVFDKPLAALYFEKGGKSELRAFFFQDKLPPGETRVHATWEFKDVQVTPPLRERLGGGAPQDWPLDPLGNAGAVPDLSFLARDEKPAGRHGAVRADNGHLEFRDGTPARFWGTNIAAYALFNTTKDEVRAQAKRLAALGYNLVRLHHHDSPWVANNIFGKEAVLSDTQSIDPDAMERIDWWIKCLEDEGIYVWMDLHVQRALRAGDHIEGFDEIRKGRPSADLKGFDYVNPSIQQAMLRFDTAYLGHKNAFTGRVYKDDPGVVGLLLTNEDDLTQHYGNALLPDKKVPFHNKLYTDAANAFAQATGLPADKVWRSWEPGPSKLFLNDLEHRFDLTLMQALRSSGTTGLIATTNSWGNNPISSLPALTTGDMVDVHAYGPYGALEKSPFVFPNLVDWIGAAHVVGYPLTVSEWNAEPFPTEDRHVLPLYVAATADHQGWDALMHFAYSQEPPSRNSPSNWNSYNDPSLMAMMPAAALLYRERHVAEAKTTYVLDLPADDFFGRSVSATSSVALRTALERGKVLVAMPRTPALPWLQRRPLPAGAVVMTDPGKSMLPADASQSSSDTGELTRSWNDGVFTIDTERTRAALGWIGGRTISLHGVEVQLATRNASIAVQSLDGQALGNSAQLLVSIGTRSQPQANNRAPYLVEPAAGTLRIPGPAGLKFYRLASDGKQVPWPATYQEGKYVVQLDGKTPMHWLMARK